MNRKRRSVLYVEKKAARRLPTKSGALGPVIAITTVEADFPTRDSSVVSHLGCPARANPELKVRQRRVQVDTDSPRDEVEEGADFAVQKSGFRRFHSGESDSESLHSDHLYIGARQSFVYLVSEFQRGHVEGRTFPFDDQAAFSGGWSLPLGGSGNRRGSSRPGSVVGLFAFLDHCSPQWGGGWRQACSKWGFWVRSDIQGFCFGNLKRYRSGCFREGGLGFQSNYLLRKDVDAFNQRVNSRPLV